MGFEDFWFTVVNDGSYIKIMCGGGTGFAKRKSMFYEDIVEELKLLDSMEEYDLIHHCNKNRWFVWDYYKDEIDFRRKNYRILSCDMDGKETLIQ